MSFVNELLIPKHALRFHPSLSLAAKPLCMQQNSPVTAAVCPDLKLSHWQNVIPNLQKQYQSAQPFPHIVLDDFLEEEVAEQVLAAFPSIEAEDWIHYLHYNEKKHGLNKFDRLPEAIQKLIIQLNSPKFLKLVSQLSGIADLQADPSLEGGGLHQSTQGGFLNIHADFTVHPHHANWRRRVNLLLYLNKDWPVEYKGDLELWRRDMSQCERKIAPIFNRLVIFNTDEDSYHGLPEAIQCPSDRTRKSLALYYFTIEKETPRLRATHYRSRPGDGWRSILIYADRQLISIYTVLKRKLGINDDWASRVLGFLNRKKK